MNAYLVTGPAYHRIMCDDGLPHPAVGAPALGDRRAAGSRAEMLEQGGAIIVYSDDREHLLGVLTRDRSRCSTRRRSRR